MSEIAPARWSFWAIAALSLLWNGFGGYDFLMQNMRDLAYMAQVPAEAVQYLDSLPLWMLACWALGVWGAVAGSLLLLIRSRFAVAAFMVSLLGLAGNTAGRAATGGFPVGEPVGLTIAIWVVAVLLLLYAVRMRGRGVLR